MRVPAVSSISLFGMRIDATDMCGAVQVIRQWCASPRAATCRYVVTPNVDHTVMYQTNAALREAYAGASLVLADGAPVVLTARMLGRALPQRVAGSDLVPALFESVSRESPTAHKLRVFLLGAAPGVGKRAAQAIGQRWSGVEIVGTYSPPLGFEDDDQENDKIFTMVSEAHPQLLLIGLGAPKQELWVSRHAAELEARVALCVGATIDFLAGEKCRAPRWLQRLGLEWLHRLASEPTRLAGRYLRDAWIFPQLVWREWRRGQRPRKQARVDGT